MSSSGQSRDGAAACPDGTNAAQDHRPEGRCHDGARLTTWEKWAIALLGVLLLAFGANVVHRSAFLRRRMTDLDVFARAGWAVRAGEDIYATHSERDWNYVYPSFFAVVMTPLADPPTAETFDRRIVRFREFAKANRLAEADIAKTEAKILAERARLAPVLRADRGVYLPFWLTASLWYLISLGCIALSADWIARAIEATDQRLKSLHLTAVHRTWWLLRLWPALFCLPALGNGLSRGQSDAVVLLCVSGFILLTVRGRAFWAGAVLAVAIAVKVIPGLLLLYPLWRRDWRTLCGVAMGGLVCFVIVPTIAFGWDQAWAYNVKWMQVMGLPGLGVAAEDTSRKFELYGLQGSESQSFLTVLHNWANLSLARGDRPADASSMVRLLAMVLSATAVLITLWSAGWRRSGRSGASGLRGLLMPSAEVDRGAVAFVGLLLGVMLMASPVTHTHYFGFLLPIVAWLVSLDVARHGGQKIGQVVWMLAGAFVVCHALPRFAWAQGLQDIGLMCVSGVALWMLGVVALRQRTEEGRWA